jgi:predicted helicase
MPSNERAQYLCAPTARCSTVRPSGRKCSRTEGPIPRKIFHALADAGRKLADLHVHYEKQPEHPLDILENKDAPLNWRVEAMKLTKDRTALVYNEHFTFAGIPPETFSYRLGNRSALDWVIEQYRVARNDAGDILSDPNRDDDEEYIKRLIGQVIHVSRETMKIVQNLPELGLP